MQNLRYYSSYIQAILPQNLLTLIILPALSNHLLIIFAKASRQTDAVNSLAMFELTNLLDLKYCTDFHYMSDNATEIHFRISFGVTLVFKQKKSSGFLEFMEGKQGEFVEIKRQTILRRYCLKKIRWYNLDSKERSSLDEEVVLNHIKYNILDKEFEEGNRVGQGRKSLQKEIEILLEEGMSLEDY